jgi:hypothetical protein
MFRVRMRLLARKLEELEQQAAKPRKKIVPDWLLDALVGQGARVDERGELVLESLREMWRPEQ